MDVFATCLEREVFDDRLAHKITHLSKRDREIVERLVDSMLKSDPENKATDSAEPGNGN